MAFSVITLGLIILSIATLGVIINVLSLGLKLCKEFQIPKLWKYSLLYQDIAHVILGCGLILFSVYTQLDLKELCDSTGFLTVFGLFLCFFSFLTTAVIILTIQNPGKSSSLSSFHRNIVLAVITPVVLVSGVLAFIPNVATSLFDTSTPYKIHCLPIPTPGQTGAAFGVALTALWWIILTSASICDIISALKLWKFYNRVNGAQDNVWQTQLLNQGKTLLKLLLIEHIIWLLSLGLLTVVAYVESSLLEDDASWVVMTTLAVSTVLHGVFSNVGNTMWSSCCCRASNAVQEPHRKLKKLELIKIEAKGKLRMKATWSIGKGASKKGMLKVYGVSHLKSWAQEIVMLGMLRRAQHPSLIQCLWTNSSNPYYETMTLISGEIITSDSRIICLEMTNGGTLQTFLQKVELPLPEPCQRMIIHDVAEGLFYLHHENILHNNLTASCIYLKGSLQSMVLRAAIGDFEDAQIYGTLQQSFDDTIREKRYFFLPDIRSFALVALEIVSKMCEKKFQNRYVTYDSEHVPLKLNLTNCISDEEDEFGAQYGYEIEDTHRMYGGIQPEDMYYHERTERCMSPEYTMKNRNDSLENLMDKNRPMSPAYNVPNRQSTPETVCSDSDGEDREVAKYTSERKPLSSGRPLSPKVYKNSEKNSVKHETERTLSPNRVMSPSSIGKVSQRKSRKDTPKPTDITLSANRVKSPQRSLSPSMYDHERCVSPDPMKDAKLQELRKETESGKRSTKKERKTSFSRKQKSEKHDDGQAFEAFVGDSAAKQSKRKDGNWLTKPSSILKSITNNETAVSVFKAKPVDEENHLDAIEEEDIESNQNKSRQTKSFKSKEKVKGEVWDIIDEQFYTQCNKKASNKLKKTVSGESRSSLWSFISTPDDWDDDDEINNILDCLPGMAEPSELRRSAITVEEIMKEQERAMLKKNETKRFTLADLNKSKFELIDYYEMLKARQITIDQVPQDKREMLMNVVELKLEEKLKKEGKFKDNGVIRNDELYSNAMAPGGAGNDNSAEPVKVVSFRRAQQSNSATVTSGVKQVNDSRAKSAPLKRPRTPMKKPESKTPQINPAFADSQNIVKRNKARSALRKALNNKNTFNGVPRQHVRTPVGEKQDLTVKYATVKKINVESHDNHESMDMCQSNDTEVLKVPVPTKESFSITKVKPAKVSVKRYSSFSSNESSSSYLYNDNSRKTDVSLTSGELTSVSSQSESDQFETDGHMTDVEGQSAQTFNARRKVLNRGPGSRVDSGFDSGSMSSEMSAPLHSKQYYSPIQNTSAKHNVNSWARNYKSMEFIPNSPFDMSGNFISPSASLPAEKFVEQFAYPERPSSAVRNAFSYSVSANGDNKHLMDNDSGIGLSKHISNQIRSNMNEMSSGSSLNSDSTITPTMINVAGSANKGTINLNQRPMSPSQRPMSPSQRPMSPEIPVSQRPMSPERPMSPNVRPTEHRPILKAKARVLSPNRDQSTSRPTSAASNHVMGNRPFSPNGRSDQRPFSPNGRTNNRPFSPNGRSDSSPFSPNERSANRPFSPNARSKSSERPFSPAGRETSNKMRSTRHSSHSPDGRKYQNQHLTNRNTISHSPIVQINSKPLVSNKGIESAEQTSVATKRYRELVKQGVPLRASAIESSPNRKESDRNAADSMSRPNTAESTVEEPVDNEKLFDDLESKGFFANRSRSPSPAKGSSPSRSKTSNEGSKKHEGNRHRKRNKHLPLDQIVREVPDQTHRSQSKPYRSQSNNHLIVSEDAFLNQPTSEDSETCSIKTTKSSGSTPSGSRPKVVVDAELVIDRIFSQNHPDDNELDVEVEAALGLDKDPFKTMNTLYSNDGGPSTADLANMPLLNGVNQNHIHECVELVSNLHVVTVRDLLPARQESFDILRKKLHQVGQLGTVGNQLLDIINKCWLQEMPPTSGDLVEQLTDPVAETEV